MVPEPQAATLSPEGVFDKLILLNFGDWVDIGVAAFAPIVLLAVLFAFLGSVMGLSRAARWQTLHFLMPVALVYVIGVLIDKLEYFDFDSILSSSYGGPILIVVGSVSVGLLNLIVTAVTNTDRAVKDRTLQRAFEMVDGELMRNHRYNIYASYGPHTTIPGEHYAQLYAKYRDEKGWSESQDDTDEPVQDRLMGSIPPLRSIIAIVNRWDRLAWELKTHNIHRPLAKKFLYEAFVQDMHLVREIAQKHLERSNEMIEEGIKAGMGRDGGHALGNRYINWWKNVVWLMGETHITPLEIPSRLRNLHRG